MQPRFVKLLDQARTQQLDLSKQWLRQHPKELAAITAYYQDYTYPKVPQLDIDAALYEMGFWQQHEQHWMQRFHKSDWTARAESLSHPPSNRIYELAIRIIGRHHLELLIEPHQKVYDDYITCLQPNSDEQRLNDYRGQPRLSWQQALQDTDEVLAKEVLDTEQIALLQSLRVYLDFRLNA